MKCCLCLHAPPRPDGLAEDAATVINGQAVCEDHTPYVQGGTFSMALAALLRESRRDHRGISEET